MKRLAPWATLACILLLLTIYVGSYCLLVNLPLIDHIHDESNGHVVLRTERVERYYSRGGAIAEVVFWPIEQLDRRIRRTAWSP